MKTYKEFIKEGSLATDTWKTKAARQSAKRAQSYGSDNDKRYSYKEAQADFKNTYGKDAGEVLWKDVGTKGVPAGVKGGWLDSNTGEILWAKESKKPANAKEYKSKFKSGL